MSTSTTRRFSNPAQVLRAAHALMSDMWSNRARFASLAGKSFLGDRDMYEVLGFKKELVYEDFFTRYDREGLCTRIVEAFPKATWSADIEITENDEPGPLTDFEKNILSIVEDHSLFVEFLRADIEAGIGRYSIIFIGTADANLAQPMSKMSGPEGIKYLTTYGEDRAEIKGVIGDGKGNADQIKAELSDPRFGQPRAYMLTLGPGVKREVHHTRVIHVAKRRLRDKIYGSETLRRGWNDFDNLVKMVGGGSEAVWDTVDGGHQWDKLPEMGEVDEEEIADLEEQLTLRKHKKGKDVFTSGTTASSLSSPMPQFGPNVMVVIRLLSATYEIPQQILLGAESGKLASDKDRDNWQDRISEYVFEHGQPVLRSAVQRFIDFGAVQKPKDNNFKTVWSALSELTVPEAALVLTNIAKANKDNVAAGGGIIYGRNEARQDVLGKEEFEGLENLPVPSSGDGGEGADDDNDNDNNSTPPEEEETGDE